MPPSVSTAPSVHYQPMRSMNVRPVHANRPTLRSQDVIGNATNCSCIATSSDGGSPPQVTVRVVLQGTTTGVHAILQRATFHNGKTTVSVDVEPTEPLPGRKLHVVETQATIQRDSATTASVDGRPAVYSTHLIDVYTSRHHGESAVTATLVIPSGGKQHAIVQPSALDIQIVLAWC